MNRIEAQNKVNEALGILRGNLRTDTLDFGVSFNSDNTAVLFKGKVSWFGLIHKVSTVLEHNKVTIKSGTYREVYEAINLMN